MKLHFANPNPQILVLGDLMIDHYLWGTCSRISPEAPVQVIDIQKETTVLGGAGNVVNNLLTFGAKVDVGGVIGNDEAGKELRQMLEKAGAGTSLLLSQDSRKTSKKSRIIAANQQVVRYDKESKDDITKESENKLLEKVAQQIGKYQLVLLSDYNKGVLTSSFTQGVIKIANENNVKVLIDPKGTDYSKYKGAFLITPNKKEASLATKIDIKDETTLNKVGFQLKQECNLNYVVVTLSEEGIALFDKEEVHKIPTKAKAVYDVTGAGDTVLASLGFAITNDMSMIDACTFANYAAAVVISKVGSATATLSEVEEYIASYIPESNSDSAIKSRKEISVIAEDLKKRKKKIVFTNGCFDILHLGHVKYLEKAKNFGDILIVGVNADASVKRLKGEERPINPEYDRAYLLASLNAVDFVVVFEEDTPYELIKSITPEILVKGGDYEGKEVVGSDIVNEVKLVSFVEGKSTTNIINKMKTK
ncbi:MAG: D-glycero-beta-D-manno-heptose-7-phosphate kinase [Thermoflexibacter sp.]|nr:D-glycero-beta-D-manno-heptose-7-phosphate kinase [Thermoflexibacter sp.]